MKVSELELSLLRARSMEALKQKARRGELFFAVAVGYVKVGRDKIEMDPDRDWVGLHPFCRDAKHPPSVFIASR